MSNVMKNYADSFGFEWHKHNQTQVLDVEEAEKTFWLKTGLTKEELKGKTVLDAGCGAGRFTQIAAKYAKTVVGVDLSDAAEVAIENTKYMGNVFIWRSDINNLGFEDETFDIIFSLGVLHHTPSTKQSFNSLYRLLKPNGIMTVWVYSNEGFKAKAFNLISGIHRLYTTRMNKAILYKCCRVVSNVHFLHTIPLLKYLFIALFPISLHPKKEWRILDTFDWYSPKYQWKHSYSEVESWFRELNFKDIKRLEFPVSIRGIKVES
jgi:SAM-dependent methyltransferase